MIRVGISDSMLSRRLLQEKRLAVDYLEVHGPNLAAARAVLPHMKMLLHNSVYQWSMAHPGALEYAGSVTIERIADARSEWYSTHLGYASEVVQPEGGYQSALSPILAPDVLQKRMSAVAAGLREMVGVPVLLENMDFNPSGAYDTICEPGFIRSVIEESDTLLLLDLAHARVSAQMLAMDIHTYLLQLPLERVRQIHVNGPGKKDGRLVDTHLEIGDEDKILLEWALDHTEPWAITLEYNLDQDRLLEQVDVVRSYTHGR